MKPTHRLKLVPRAAPPVLAGLTAANLLSRSVWNKVRGRVMEEAGTRCETCRASYRDRMVCDEVWSYNQKRLLATLMRLRLLCQACNSVTHLSVVLRQHPLGVVLCLGESGPRLEVWSDADAEPALRAFTHMMRVNHIGVKKVEETVLRTVTHSLRSDHRKWKVKVARRLLCKYPELRVLDGRTSASRLRKRVAARWLATQ